MPALLQDPKGRKVEDADQAVSEAGEVYRAMDMPWAKLVGQVAQAYGK